MFPYIKPHALGIIRLSSVYQARAVKTSFLNLLLAFLVSVCQLREYQNMLH